MTGYGRPAGCIIDGAMTLSFARVAAATLAGVMVRFLALLRR